MSHQHAHDGHSHGHGHGHGHGHAHTHGGHDLEARNKQHWDENAKKYDFPASIYLTNTLSKYISETYLSSKNNNAIALLDYACGPGSVTFPMLEAGSIGKLVGADVSSGMVDFFHEKAEKKDFPKEKARAVLVTKHNLAEAVGGEKFDIVLCTHAYHHFDDVEGVTATLSSVLKPGGQLIVADWLAVAKPYFGEDHEVTAKEFGVHHMHGFEPKKLEEIFKSAGLTDIKTDTKFSVSKQKLIDLGGEEGPLKTITANIEAEANMRYVIAVGTKST